MGVTFNFAVTAVQLKLRLMTSAYKPPDFSSLSDKGKGEQESLGGRALSQSWVLVVEDDAVDV